MKKNLTREERVAWLRKMGEPVPAHLLEPQADVADRKVSHGDPPKERDGVASGGAPHERPRCAKCGGQPSLGRCGADGKVESYCRKCADEEYLALLTPEERALLR